MCALFATDCSELPSGSGCNSIIVWVLAKLLARRRKIVLGNKSEEVLTGPSNAKMFSQNHFYTID